MASMMHRSDLKYDLALLFAVLVWGINFSVVKAALAVMPPHVLNVFRFIVSALVLGGLYVAEHRRRGVPLLDPVRKHGWALVSLGLLGFLFYQFCFIVGVDHTTAGNAALIMASAPLWTALVGHFFGYEHLPRAAWIGLMGSLVGASVIVLGSARAIDLSNDMLVGNALMFLAAILWGAYTAFSKPMGRVVSPVGISFIGLIAALPFLMALGAPLLDTVTWEEVDLWVWLAILYSGSLSTGLTVAIWNAAIKHVGPSQTAVYGNLVPAVGLVSGVLLLGEKVTLIQIGGGVLILGGLLLMRRARYTQVPARERVYSEES